MRTTVIALVAAAIAAFACSPKSTTPPTNACPADAKVCPDGSSVGRTGPNCEFAKCPGEGTDPCAGVDLPPCPAECPAESMSHCGQPCDREGDRCGNAIGDGMTCQGGTWNCTVHAPLGPGCNRVCR